MKFHFLVVLLLLGAPSSITAQSTASSKAQQVQMHEQKARELISQKKPELAAKEYAAILVLDPQNVNAQANLGVLLYFQKDYAGAEPHLRNAVDQQPDLFKIR